MRRRRHRFALLCLSLAALVVARVGAAGMLQVQVVDDAGKPVADAVVYASPRGGKAPAAAATERLVMDQRDKEFVPYVLPVQVGTPVYFPNSDNIRHHVYSFSPAKTFELPLYKGTPANPVVFDKPGVVALGCNIHDWMVGYVYVVDTPWYATTGDHGSAGLTLPAGEYELRAWHPRLKGSADATLRPVAVGTNNAVHAEFRIALHPDRRKPRPADYDPSQYNYN